MVSDEYEIYQDDQLVSYVCLITGMYIWNEYNIVC